MLIFTGARVKKFQTAAAKKILRPRSSGCYLKKPYYLFQFKHHSRCNRHRRPKFSLKTALTMESAQAKGYCRMTHFDKPLLFMVAANLFAAVFPITARAETANAQDARMVRLDAQIAAA